MGCGRKIEVELADRAVRVRDYGRGIPLGKVLECVSIINTGAKYDSETFKKAVGLNGIGQKAVNALSSAYRAQAVPRGPDEGGRVRTRQAEEGPQGREDRRAQRHARSSSRPTRSCSAPDFRFRPEFIEDMLWKYAFLNRGLTLTFNGKPFKSENGLKDLLEKNLSGDILYPIIHLEGDDIEIAFTHGSHYGEEYYSFVNGQHTTMGGTHQQAFREAVVEMLRNFYKKDFDAADVRQSIVAAVSVRVIEPVFESQTKTKLGSADIGARRPADPAVHRHVRPADSSTPTSTATARRPSALKRKLEENERERKELAGIRSLARERAKKASLHNRKLRDCRLHLGDRDERAEESTLFIVEGDSAAGSLTACRDVQTQAVFALKGKPLNTYGLSKKVIYENEEFHLLQSALNIEEGLDGLRYGRS